MRRLFLLLLLLSGCRTWEVRAFGVPLGEEPRYVTADTDLTGEEKVGVIVVLAAAVAASVAIALAVD
jgi:hypothetical protein